MVAAAKLPSNNEEVGEPLDEHEEWVQGDDSGLDVPLSQLVLETYFGCKRRPYDRKRQDELAKPKRVASASVPPDGGVSLDQISSRSVLMDKESKDKQDSLIARLSQPKKQPPRGNSSGECILAMVQHEERSKRANVDVDAMLQRLATPRRRQRQPPTPGERVLPCYNKSAQSRSVDLHRINAMAKPTRRGGSCTAWLRPSSTWVGDSIGRLSARDNDMSWHSAGNNFSRGATALTEDRGVDLGDFDYHNAEGYAESPAGGIGNTNNTYHNNGSSDSCNSNGDASDYLGGANFIDDDYATTFPDVDSSPGRGQAYMSNAGRPHSGGWRTGVDRYV